MTFDPILIWFLAGLALIVAEFALPGVILVFFGLGSWITATTTWIGLTPGLTGQLLTFAVSSTLLLVLLRRRFRARFAGYVGENEHPENNLDDPAGQEVTVMTDIAAGQTGQVEYKGALWRARGEEAMAAGTTATILRTEGITLIVVPRR